MAPSLLSACPTVFVPLTIVIATTCVIGCIGNTLAFYIFNFRYPPSGFNTLLAALAAFDVFACLVHMPLDIVTFSDVGPIRSYLCKITCFQLAFTATGSALILLVIAIVRFNGIRNPMLGQFQSRSAYFVIFISVLLAAGISLPITILFGTGNIQVSENRTVEICAVEKKFMHTAGPLSYYFILAGLYIITFITHSGLYAQAMFALWRTKRVFVSMRGKKNVVMMSPATTRSKRSIKPIPSPRVDALRGESTPSLSRDRAESGNSIGRLMPDTDSESGSTASSANGSVRFTLPDGSSTLPVKGDTNEDYDDIIELNTMAIQGPPTSTPSPSPRPGVRPIPATRKHVPVPKKSGEHATSTSSANLSARTDSVNSKTKKSNSESTGTQNIGNYRILAVVVAISMTYFLSYAPHFGVMFYLFTHDASVFSKSSQNLVFELLMRSFFLNNILDPVIYGLLSAEFRREVTRTFRRVKKSCCPCKF
ncbi:P2Y purinoceptor 1 [Elysia marginata]|uniref:P2Y purinoceptor 1 n=1 Tax=Elysia marginata TaxID=1093978 RepID=A0AAV4H0S4_9GAST|nr:P2Y purinoceptor 1 [Elysia marginata]